METYLNLVGVQHRLLYVVLFNLNIRGVSKEFSLDYSYSKRNFSRLGKDKFKEIGLILSSPNGTFIMSIDAFVLNGSMAPNGCSGQ